LLAAAQKHERAGGEQAKKYGKIPPLIASSDLWLLLAAPASTTSEVEAKKASNTFGDISLPLVQFSKSCCSVLL
jgi:hypothetical protein